MILKQLTIAGGTGFIGRYLTQHFLEQGAQVTIIGRSQAKIERCFRNTVTPLEWHKLKQLGSQAFKHQDLIINLTGATIGDKRWTTKRKQEIIESRIQSTTLIANLLAKLGQSAPPLFNASAVGIYGTQTPMSDQLPPALSEHAPIDFTQFPDFLAKVGRLWEMATHNAKIHQVRVVNLRFGVVLGKGGALSQIIIPYRYYLGGRLGSGQQPFPWIAIADLARAIEFIAEQPSIRGPINLVAPQCITQAQFARAISNVINKPAIFVLPGFVLRCVLGEMATLLLSGQHVTPKLLLSYSFEFQYPDIESALRNALTS